jgi:single-strand DNA-binding protein
MTDTVIHMVGHVGTDVAYRRLESGADLSTFRLAVTPRRWDRNQRQYVDGVTNWMNVTCWRALAVNVKDSVRCGDPVIVTGKLKTDEWTQDGERKSRFTLEASSVGHDLSRGTSVFRKTPKRVEPQVDDSAELAEVLEQLEAAEPVPYEESFVEPSGEGESSAA